MARARGAAWRCTMRLMRASTEQLRAWQQALDRGSALCCSADDLIDLIEEVIERRNGAPGSRECEGLRRSADVWYQQACAARRRLREQRAAAPSMEEVQAWHLNMVSFLATFGDDLDESTQQEYFDACNTARSWLVLCSHPAC